MSNTTETMNPTSSDPDDQTGSDVDVETAAYNALTEHDYGVACLKVADALWFRDEDGERSLGDQSVSQALASVAVDMLEGKTPEFLGTLLYEMVMHAGMSKKFDAVLATMLSAHADFVKFCARK